MYIRHYGPSVSCKRLTVIHVKSYFQTACTNRPDIERYENWGGGVRAMGIRAISINL